MLAALATSFALALAPGASITDQLTPSRAAIEITSEPTGTTLIHVAVMQNMQAAGLKYFDRPASETTITPPAGYPVIDVQAKGTSGAIGGWAGRLQTEPPKEETLAEKEAREKAEKEAKERAEKEAREKAEREAKEKAEREKGLGMTKALNTGGWVSESIVADFAGSAKYFRSGYKHWNTDERVGWLAKYGVTLMPLFGEGGCLASYNNSTYTGEIVAWFKRYGHGGTFWAGKTDLGATTAEIINEPGNPYLTCESSNKALYAEITRKVHTALEANFPAATRPKALVSYDGGFSGDQYGREIFAVGAQADGVTVHPYGGKSNVTKSAEGGRTRVTEAHASGLPVYVTEVGWPTALGQPPTGDSLQWSESQQVANITNFIQWARSLGYVADVTIFNNVDYGSNDFYGVERKDRSHKPSYAALAGA